MLEITGTINRFIFQIINSLIESWGVHLTCLDCKILFTFTVKNCLHCVLTAPQVTSLLLFGPQAIPVTRWPCWTMYNACKILVFLLKRVLNNVLCIWNIHILIMKGIKTNKMVLRVLVACTAAQVEQIDLFFNSECYLQRYKRIFLQPPFPSPAPRCGW